MLYCTLLTIKCFCNKPPLDNIIIRKMGFILSEGYEMHWKRNPASHKYGDTSSTK